MTSAHWGLSRRTWARSLMSLMVVMVNLWDLDGSFRSFGLFLTLGQAYFDGLSALGHVHLIPGILPSSHARWEVESPSCRALTCGVRSPGSGQ